MSTEVARYHLPMLLEFHFDFASPNAYLAHLLVKRIETRQDIKFDYIPVLLGGVFKATNNVPPMEVLRGIENKIAYHQVELHRWLAANDIAGYEMNPHFPVNTLQLMRGAVYAKTQPWFAKYLDEVYRMMWQDGKKMDDVTVIQEEFDKAGLPTEALMQAMQDPEIKQQLIANTENSVQRGNFGAPTFFVGAEMFFGKDRLDAVEALIDIK